MPHKELLLGMCVVLIGSLSDGFRVVGPFKTFDDADRWDLENNDYPGWIMQLESADPDA